MSEDKRTGPTRLLTPIVKPDGSMTWKSFTHNAKIGGEIRPNPDLPGLIIFVHGVNSEGEWYDRAEEQLCEGLNERLNLEKTEFKLKANEYHEPVFEFNKNDPENSRFIYKEPIRTLKKQNRSPVIRFYWGYRAQDDELDNYRIPLKNRNGDSFHFLKRQLIEQVGNAYHNLPTYEQKSAYISQALKSKGPFFWGGGPFQNGCHNLVSLWSEVGFDNWVKFNLANVQAFNPESDRILTKAPPRHYYAHAAGRLAKLIKTIRQNNPNDTVTVISHSQGTMVALAAAAIEPPDGLFVLNSPYSLSNKMMLNAFSYPFEEITGDEQRVATFADIVNKVAGCKDRLSRCNDWLSVGLTEQGRSWRPENTVKIQKKKNSSADPEEIHYENIEGTIDERDNHGNTYIYCNPHDRVMGSSPLQSIGWSGVLNVVVNGKGQPHPLFSQVNTLYVRMLARNTDCGKMPDPNDEGRYTVFSDSAGNFRDHKPFWDSNTNTLQKMAWPNPAPNLSININALEVPCPIEAGELSHFDEDFPREEASNSNDPSSPHTGIGYGKISINPKTQALSPVDSDYYYYKDIYSYGERKAYSLSQEEKKTRRADPLLTPQERNQQNDYETLEQMRDRIRNYIQRPTDHSTLPQNIHFLRRVMTYDLPIGRCEQGHNPEILAKLRRQADWLSGGDPYLEKGELTLPDMPPEIKR